MCCIFIFNFYYILLFILYSLVHGSDPPSRLKDFNGSVLLSAENSQLCLSPRHWPLWKEAAICFPQGWSVYKNWPNAEPNSLPPFGTSLKDSYRSSADLIEWCDKCELHVSLQRPNVKFSH